MPEVFESLFAPRKTAGAKPSKPAGKPAVELSEIDCLGPEHEALSKRAYPYDSAASASGEKDLAVEVRDGSGTLLGFVWCNCKNDADGQLVDVYIANAAAQGGGLGGKLLKHAGKVALARAEKADA